MVKVVNFKSSTSFLSLNVGEVVSSGEQKKELLCNITSDIFLSELIIGW